MDRDNLIFGVLMTAGFAAILVLCLVGLPVYERWVSLYIAETKNQVEAVRPAKVSP